MVTLMLSELPADTYGIYGPSKNILAQRMRYLHVDAARAFMADLYPRRICLSDVFRSADASIQARHEKTGVQPPGKSGHNYGFSIDVDLDRTLKEWGMSKAAFDDFMNANGWYCHRKDHLIEPEAWHYNYFGPSAAKYLGVSAPYHSTAAGLEAMIQDRYGSAFVLSAVDVQACLKALKFYGGDIDGQVGTLSVRAIKAFQAAWDLDVDGTAGKDTMRLLAYLNNTVNFVPVTHPLVG